jgi:hypothetical protein
MTDVPFTESCSMLGVSAKTLRQWLKHSHMSLHQSPMDARVKCLTIEQLEQLAILHGRSIKLDVIAPPEPEPAPLAPVQPEKPTHLQPRSQLPSPFRDDSDLAKSLSSLEAVVANLQQQVTQLALELLHERERTFERRLSTLEALVMPPIEPPPSSQATSVENLSSPSDEVSDVRWRPNPAELRARSRLISLIEYGARGTYVIISPQAGELSIVPDSQEWFDWLASLSSFRFMGPSGRFTAYRESTRNGPTRGWSAVRCVRGHRYKCYLGVTDRLTISRLEQATAILQSHMTSL